MILIDVWMNVGWVSMITNDVWMDFIDFQRNIKQIVDADWCLNEIKMDSIEFEWCWMNFIDFERNKKIVDFE